MNYRFRGEKTVDALVEWVATSLLKLPRILYCGAKGLVTHNTHYLSNSFVVEVLQGCLCCLCLEFAIAHFILVWSFDWSGFWIFSSDNAHNNWLQSASGRESWPCHGEPKSWIQADYLIICWVKYMQMTDVIQKTGLHLIFSLPPQLVMTYMMSMNIRASMLCWKLHWAELCL